ncbi:MAG: methyl-accepting chemotaxis protein [Clostridiales bacterium]|nr:methyl-accepting chemotaxis protein [Clostridiales bacterium]
MKATKNSKRAKANKAEAKDKTQSGMSVPFMRSIRGRLILCFLVPVICIIVLGVASYLRASNAIVSNYESSTAQTAEMMQQYVSLVVSGECDEFKSYLTVTELQQYFSNNLTEVRTANIQLEYETTFRNMISENDKLSGIYFIADHELTMTGTGADLPDDAYSAYVATGEGAEVAQDQDDWLLFGRNSEVDEALGLSSDDYALRVVHKMKDADGVIMVSLSSDYISSAMQSIDAGDDGHVILVTGDGVEFYSDGSTSSSATIMYGTTYYSDIESSSDGQGAMTASIGGRQYLLIFSKLTSGDGMVVALIPSDMISAQSQSIKLLTIVMTVVAAIIAIMLGVVNSGSISSTIKEILRQLRKVAKGDLTVQMRSKRKDELGLLCAGINDMVENVKKLIMQVNTVSEHVGESAMNLMQMAGTFMETSQDIQSAVSDIETGVNRLDVGSGDCMNQMDELSNKISNVSSNAGEIERLTTAAGTTINSGINSVKELTNSAQSTAEITRSVISSIEELENKSRSISQIVLSINEIAEQTNLLSLNASIEAARAGEAGKGFAVVAEEIRKLSDQCLDSAGQIAAIVDDIVNQTRDVVGIAKQAEDAVSSQSGAVDETTSSFQQIDEQVEELIEALNTISNNVQDMNGARNETLVAIESISAASTETAACSTSVYDAAGTQVRAIEDLNAASQQLAANADSLLDILTTFQV